MKKYYKLNLNECIYWQSSIEDDKTFYTKSEHNTRNNELLNNIYLLGISPNKYMELDSKRIIEFDDNSIIKPLGVDIPLSSISPSSAFDILKEYKKIQVSGLTDEYRKIVDEIFIKSRLCELASHKKEVKLGLLKRY